MPDDGKLWVLSAVNPKGEPFVRMFMGDKPLCQMSVGECREHAQNCAEVAEAAETDAFLFWFFKTHGGSEFDDPAKIAFLIHEFRKFREARGGVTAPRPEHFPQAKTP